MNRLVVLIVVFASAFSVKAQQNQVLFESTLWFKPHSIDSTVLKNKAPVKQLLNFNRQLDFNELKINKSYNSLVNRKSSLFFVYMSPLAEEKDLIVLQSGLSKTTVTTNRIIADKETVFDKSSPEQGTLISHIFNRQSQSRKYGNMSFSDILFNDIDGNVKAYEMIYMPRCINESEKNSVESYLSIKYGISLLGERSYTNHKGDTLWNHKENAGYSNRITGLGRDDQSGLYQKQSGNYTKDGLYISLGKLATSNEENTSQLQDNVFLLWGDNGLKTNFNDHSSSQLRMDRVWKVVKYAKGDDAPATQIIIRNKEMKLIKDGRDEKIMWLAMDTISDDRIDYNRAVYHKAAIQNDSLIVFNDIKWHSKKTLFTFVTGPEFMVNYNLTACSCGGSYADGKSEIVMLNGTAPFRLNIKGHNFDKTIDTSERSYVLEGLPKDHYVLKVTDASDQSSINDFSIDAFTANEVSVAPEWYLFPGEVTLVHPIYEGTETLTYQWLLNGRLQHTGSDYEPSKEGNYIMKATNTSGCSMEVPFHVLNSPELQGNNYSVYPNPCKANQWFTITGTSDLVHPTTISVFDMNGRVLISKDLGVTDEFTYRDSLPQSATYLVIIAAGDQRNVVKLIIN